MSYGIPNPYVATTHPYPAPATGGKGGSWRRPVTGPLPYQRSTQSVFLPDGMNDGNPALRGLGELLFNAENGVFGTAKGGGGVFGPSLYGLGDAIDAPIQWLQGQQCSMPTVCGQVLNNPAASAKMDLSLLDANGNFGKYCADPAYQSHITSACAAAIAAATPVASGQQGSSTDKPAVMAVQTTLNGALVNAGYRPLVVDGVPGAALCGAIKWYRQQTGNATAGQQFDAVCVTKGSTAPTKASAAPAYKAPVYAPPAATPGASSPAQASFMSAGTWAMIGGGALAIGLAVIGKRKGWF